MRHAAHLCCCCCCFTTAEHVGVSLLHQLSTVRAVCVAVYLIHVLEAVYAFRTAQQAGHRDTAPSWFLQTFVLGFPSINLVNQLKNGRGGSGGDGGATERKVATVDDLTQQQ